MNRLVFVFLLAACSSSKSKSLDAGGNVDASSASHDLSTGSCTGGGPFGGGETTMPGGTVTATVIDQTGAPLVGQPVYICGLNLCSDPSMTDSNGHVSITSALMMKKPAAKFGDGVAYTELVIPLTQTATTNDFGTLTTAKFPATGASLAAGTSATSGDVTVDVPVGAAIGIDSIVYDTPALQQFRAQSIPIASTTALFAPVKLSSAAADFILLYGIAPAETTICPPAKVSVTLPSGTTSLTANSAVEFWTTTSDTGQTYAPYAGWTKISDGKVSNDGKSVATNDGEGFYFLNTFAIRLKH